MTSGGAGYEVRFVASAAKEFRSLPPDIKHRVARAVDLLGQNPRARGVQQLAGRERFYRIRVGLYRIIYQIDDQARLVRITRVRHRREAYR